MTVLPGSFPPGAVARRVTSLSFVASLFTNGSGNINMPTALQGVLPGDFAVLADTAVNEDAGISDGVPVGFTALAPSSYGDSGSTFNWRARLSAKVLTAADIGAVKAGFAGNTSARKGVIVFRPNAPISIFAAGAAFSVATHDDVPGSQTIAAAGELRLPLLAVGLMYSDASGSRVATGMTELQNPGYATQFMHYRLFNAGSTPVNMTYSNTANGNQSVLHSGYIVF